MRTVKLNGGMGVAQREGVLSAFKEDPAVRVILISLKAGGVAPAPNPNPNPITLTVTLALTPTLTRTPTPTRTRTRTLRRGTTT